MKSTKYTMWVTGVGKKEKIIYAEGHKKLEDGSNSGIRFQLKLDFEWLEIMLDKKDFKDIKQPGRLFYYFEEEKEHRIELTRYPGLTEEEKDGAMKFAKETYKKWNLDDNQPSSSND